MRKAIFPTNDTRFGRSVRTEVDRYFRTNQRLRSGNSQLFVKSAVFISASLFIYILLLSGYYSPAGGVLLCILFGISSAGIAMNVMHDACHGAYSQKKWVNDLFSLSMNALGSNAFLWKIKHNLLHHTYTNIGGLDSDIENWPLLRQHPDQKWLPVHRYQHIYMFVLYAITTMHWMLYFDFEKYFTGRFATHQMRKMDISEHAVFWFSKSIYALFYVAIPVYLLGWFAWLLGFLLFHCTMGLVLIIIFQLAHLVEQVGFPASPDGRLTSSAWADHEVATTSNFATGNRLLSWYFGGLNFQIEHHLFPRVSHVHYPAISEIVRQQCEMFHLPYHAYPRLGDAIHAHVRLMKKLGEKGSGKGKERSGGDRKNLPA